MRIIDWNGELFVFEKVSISSIDNNFFECFWFINSLKQWSQCMLHLSVTKKVISIIRCLKNATGSSARSRPVLEFNIILFPKTFSRTEWFLERSFFDQTLIWISWRCSEWLNKASHQNTALLSIWTSLKHRQSEIVAHRIYR